MIVLGLIGGGGYLASRQLYFIGTNAQGVVTVYRGLPYDLPAGIQLYETYYVSGVPASLIPPDRRRPCSTITCARSPTPRNLIRQLELGTSPVSGAGRAGADERPQPRAARADPGVAARHGRLRRRVHPALERQLSNVSLTYGAIFLGLCRGRARRSSASRCPTPIPTCSRSSPRWPASGSSMVYRIDPTAARQQAHWFVLGLVLFAATIIAFRDYRKLERYRYTIVAVSLGAAVLPRLPGIGYQANGAYLGVRIPGLFVFQPAEFAKIGLVIFLASYLRDTRQVLVMGARRFLGVTLPPLKHFGPMLVIWGLAMLIMFLLHDIGSSLMFYGGLLAMLYVATGRAVVRRRRAARVRHRRLVPGRPHPPRARPRARPGCTRSTRCSTTRSGAASRSPTRCSPRRREACSAQGFGQADRSPSPASARRITCSRAPRRT